MRVSCLQENLAKGLSIVGRAVSPRSTLPVLGNILLEAKDGQLRLAATNLEIGINCWIGAKVEDEGSITVPARLLADFVNNLPPERIDLELAVRTQTLNLRCARYTATMKGIDAAQFPFVAAQRARRRRWEHDGDHRRRANSLGSGELTENDRPGNLCRLQRRESPHADRGGGNLQARRIADGRNRRLSAQRAQRSL